MLCSLNELSGFSVPRCLKSFMSSDCNVELHFFSDASESALGSCCYLRAIDRQGQVSVNLVMSRSKVAPRHKTTIPRLELEAAVMSAKMSEVLYGEVFDMHVSAAYFWVDSEVVLKYISSESARFKTFVANRVAFIREVSVPEQWNHVSGKDNIADVISRGQRLTGERSDLWLHGPLFLRKYHSEWSTKVPFTEDADADDPELKKACTTAVLSDNPLEALCHHYSHWCALKRAVAWILRLKQTLKKKKDDFPFLRVAELRAAEHLIIKHIQKTHYEDEIDCLIQKKPLKLSSDILKLDPFLDEDGILHVGGRLRQFPSSANTVLCANPILIPHRHIVTQLIASHYHCIAHLGTEWVVGNIRSVFWITHARSVVSTIGRSCVVCKKKFARPASQKMSDLPASRIEPYLPPFTHTGIDCFGPFHVKRARSELKRYGCIFVCFNTRAIHLEILDFMDADSFINAFRRFAARRGQPKQVWSDNGSNFIAGHKELFCLPVEKFAVSKDVEWHFRPPLASHMGGVWERLIRTVRKVILGVIPGNIRLNDESLRTWFCEIEALVNSRPLTKVSSDISDGAVLTPSHFLMLRASFSHSPGSFQDTDLLRRRWKCVQRLSEIFWAKWLHEYLPSHQIRQKWCRDKPNVKIGDVVLLVDENSPRGVWPLGLIIDVRKSADDRVRSVRLRTKNGHELVRPVTKVVPLECVG